MALRLIGPYNEDCPWCAVVWGPHYHQVLADGNLGIFVMSADRLQTTDVVFPPSYLREEV